MHNLVLSPIDTDVLVNRIAEKTVELLSKPKEDLSNKRYSIKESAKILDVIPLTIRNHIKSGTIKAERFGRKYYILHSELFGALNEVKSLKYKR